jgi:soluble lytic murein transglycosylase
VKGQFFLALGCLSLSTPSLAQSLPLSNSATAQLVSSEQSVAVVVPSQLTLKEREQYRGLFADIRAQAWADAATRLAAMPDGLLSPIAKAELYLAKGSPKIDAPALISLIERAPDLPQALRLAELARSRGANNLPGLPQANELVRTAAATRRINARTTRADAVAAQLGPQIIGAIKDRLPGDAEVLLSARAQELSSDARTEWTQRVAWSYFLNSDDANARRLASEARMGFGDWAAQAEWTLGLASWRQNDFAAASSAFARVVERARDPEMTAGGLFWSARADTANSMPQLVQNKLRRAAKLNETFYGMLAAGQLGLTAAKQTQGPDFVAADWERLATRRNVKVAAALAEIGETTLADQLLRYQARIGDPNDHPALLQLAGRLNLPATQLWFAQNTPRGAQASVASRFPAPAWTPRDGWRVDRALLFGVALQESQFRADAVSHAGARGLMQLMPGTAALVARRKGETIDRVRLNEPATNMEYGQSYLEQLRDMPGIEGLLPKVIAAYNAGPGSVIAWKQRPSYASDDPLMFIESIPFIETRSYVATVLRNYWMYQQQAGDKLASLKALAQGLWPKFPGMAGKGAVRR